MSALDVLNDLIKTIALVGINFNRYHVCMFKDYDARYDIAFGNVNTYFVPLFTFECINVKELWNLFKMCVSIDNNNDSKIECKYSVIVITSQRTVKSMELALKENMDGYDGKLIHFKIPIVTFGETTAKVFKYFCLFDILLDGFYG